MTALFRLSNVTKSYAQRQVLNIDSLQIKKGHIYCVLGPNGSGKSTLVRIMSLITSNSSGSIEVFGEKINWERKQLLRLRRQMAMVTQRNFMFEGSVYQNVAYGLKVRKCPEKTVRKTVNESLEWLGMQDFINYNARNLSGGERQKVAIARALAINPRVLFLDEPTSNIDPSSAMDIEKHIRAINQAGTTIVLITHNLFQARRLAEQIFFLWEGQIIEAGAPRDLFKNPGDERTKSFLRGEF